MAIKALNDTTGPDHLVPILLVFETYPHINQDSPSFPEITQQTETIQKAMKMLREIHMEVAINRILNTRNGPHTHNTLNLSLGNEMMI